MARMNSTTELEALRQQQIELAKKIKQAEVKARQKEKADNERREQLAGRTILGYLAANPESSISKAIIAVLNTSLVRTSERALFGNLLEAPETPSTPAHSEATVEPLPPTELTEAAATPDLVSEVTS